ncbi:hypothetical protein GCM10023165_11870 [Variovorax defluvii]|uniref:DUF5625 domain-containing protein n=1 Tax=Variovorax defluvii TaxID=913761 RepID=A0ABP8H803_9BURK
MRKAGGAIDRRIRAASAAAAVAFALALAGCWFLTPRVLTVPGHPLPVAQYFPSARLAEPIRLRKGHIHTTQPFTIKEGNERWAVALGFVRSDVALSRDRKMNGGSDICWTDGPDEGMHFEACTNATPGFHVQWELLRDDGTVAVRHARDNLVRGAGGTYGTEAITRTLSGFRDQRPGVYRLRITVMRDAKELDFLKPHILLDRPFFDARTNG